MEKTDKNRYKNSKIYKLIDNNDYFYIGSTINTLAKRLHGHKEDSKKSTRRVHIHFNSIGWDNVKIILISEHCLDNKSQLLQIEDSIIQEHKYNEKCLNCLRPFATKEEILLKKKEWENINKEKIIKYQKIYRQENCDKLKSQNREWYAENKEHVLQYQKEYIRNNIEKVKERKHNYYESNKDTLSKQRQGYYQTVKDKLLDKYLCICGSEIVICSKIRHERSKKHIQFIQTATGLLVE